MVAPTVVKTAEAAEAIAAGTEGMAVESDLWSEAAAVVPGLEYPEFGASVAHIVAQLVMVGFVDLKANVDAASSMWLVGST